MSRPATTDDLRNAVAEVKATIAGVRSTIVWLLVAAGAAVVLREAIAADRARQAGVRKPVRRARPLSRPRRARRRAVRKPSATRDDEE